MNKIKYKIKNLFGKVLDLIYPFDVSCAMCGEEIKEAVGSGICEDCSKFIEPIEDGRVVYDKLKVYSYTQYQDVARKIVLQEKDSNKPYLTDTTVFYLNKLIVNYNIEADYIAYVPSSKRNLKRRGYDAMKIVATKLSERVGIPLLKNFERIKDSVDQTETETTEERIENVKGCFSYKGKPLNGKRILIIDDVITTGATLNECAEVLQKSNPLQVSGLTFCRASVCI